MSTRYSPVISPESLVFERVREATDRTDVIFNEAVRLWRAVKETANWAVIESRSTRRIAKHSYSGSERHTRGSWRSRSEPRLLLASLD